ncbi:SDR family NAD(P)-dependent oxidoreductase [Solicola gregarius]|uniref:SDR family oxidoreductase n=1 Tax=Solicola gregarius TaxID=2908642 RepID=A0AA46TER1_9ACTN|nr:SDR family oxidoreductase [Solicola gregarius]UYM03843.1 SDR family oxidoreductase [Solicola gregarius]
MSAPELAGRVALVTGASKGIGAETARAFAAAGAGVVLAARDVHALEGVRDEIEGRGGKALVVPTDVAADDAVAQLLDTTMRTYGRLDFAANAAAAHTGRPRPLAELTTEEFDTALAVGVRGLFLSLTYEIRAMLDSGGGSIVNIASTACLQAVSGLADYVTAKHAMIGMTKTAALDYAAEGIRVNALAPGPILTEQLERAGADAQAGVAAAVPVGRIGRPDEVAAATLWLCGDDSEFVTGSVLTIDGGRLAGTPRFR